MQRSLHWLHCRNRLKPRPVGPGTRAGTRCRVHVVKPPGLRSPTWRSSRLQLVFWRFGTVPGIVALLVAGITGYWAKVPVLLTSSVLRVAPSGRGTAFLPPSSAPFAFCLLLLLVPSLLKRFWAVLRSLAAGAARSLSRRSDGWSGSCSLGLCLLRLLPGFFESQL